MDPRENKEEAGAPELPNALCPLCGKEICIDTEENTVLCPCCGEPIMVIEAVFQYEKKTKGEESAEPAPEEPEEKTKIEEAAPPAAPDFTELLEEEPKEPEEAENAPEKNGERRRIGLAAAAAAVVLAGGCLWGSAASPKELTVTVEAECADYNHVGNEWTLSYSINGEEIRSGDRVRLKKGEEILCESVVTENDESSPDTNSETTAYTVTAEDLKSGFELSHQNVVVTEDRGRYTGESCTWEIVFRFDR